MTMDVDTRQLEQYRRKLQQLGKDVMPRVVAETLNTVAGFAHVQTQRNLRSKFTLRNKYTERSIKFYQARERSKWEQINAITGSISPYMDMQDTGGTKRPKQGSKVPMARLVARGNNKSGVVRKKYKAGSLGPNQFVGAPRGSGNRPPGVWERHRKNKRLRMIRSLENETIDIKPTRWHRDGVAAWAKMSVINNEFAKNARKEIAKLS
jgi:hypothetical protein